MLPLMMGGEKGREVGGGRGRREEGTTDGHGVTWTEEERKVVESCMH